MVIHFRVSGGTDYGVGATAVAIPPSSREAVGLNTVRGNLLYSVFVYSFSLIRNGTLK